MRSLPRAVLLLAILPGCHRPSPPPPAAAAVPDGPPPPAPVVRLEAEVSTRESSGLVLARIDETRRAFVADEDDQAIVEADPAGNTSRTTPLHARPRDLLLLPDGTLAATLPDANAIALLTRDASGAIHETRRVRTPVEPMAMGIAPDGKHVFVSSGASHTLTAYALPDWKEERRWDLPREPRAVAVANDGARVFVTHASTGWVSIVPTSGDGAVAKVDAGNGVMCTDMFCTGHRHARGAQAVVRIGEKGIVVPAAQVQPRPPQPRQVKMMVPRPAGSDPFDGIDSEPGPRGGGMAGYGMGAVEAGPPVFFDVATLDGTTGTRVSEGRFVRNGSGCLLPRAAVAAGDTLVVACLGQDRLEQFKNPHGDSASNLFVTSAEVPKGPTALAVTREANALYVWSAFDRTLSRVALDAMIPDLPKPSKHGTVQSERRAMAGKPDVTLAIGRAVARDEAWLRGRELFHKNGDARISVDGRACATCHVDGRDDGLTWDTPAGPRRTRLLAGQLATAPYGWTGEHATLEVHVRNTFKQLGGKGLPEEELAALLTYVRSLPSPPRLDPGPAQTGPELFARAECDHCHTKGGSDREVHDVGTGGAFMTPTLAGIGTRVQLMHDGRHSSLEELIEKSKRMGTGSELTPAERKVLAEYLATL